MGHNKKMSIASSEEKSQNESYIMDENNLLVPKSKQTPNNKEVDFFNDRDYYKIFLETSKE